MRDRRSFLKATALGAVGLTVAFTRLARAGARGGELHLALLSDTHVPGDRKNGHRGFNPWENLRAAVPQVVAARPDGVVVCGDVARLEGRPEDYTELRALLEPLAADDTRLRGARQPRRPGQLPEGFPTPPGALAPVRSRHVTLIEHPTLRVIVLDSLLYVNQVAGLLGQAQRGGWKRPCRASPTGRWSCSPITRRRTPTATCSTVTGSSRSAGRTGT